MSRTIEAIMRHMVPSSERDAVPLNTSDISPQMQGNRQVARRRRERKLRVVFAPLPFNHSHHV
jgi:hypothetical protein